jgi:regulator of sigma E protease
VDINATFTAVISLIIVLGIMVLVHEWGHFFAARRFGVRVDIFSVGFGPRIWGRKKGDTDYRLSALPLGGYVKMAGDNPSEERSGAPDEFLSKPRWQRAIIAVAGPVMNIITAFVLLIILFGVIGAPYPAFFDNPPEIAGVGAKTEAAKAGIQPGDRVVDINGVQVKTWKAVLQQLSLAKSGSEVSVQLDRNGSSYTIEVPIKSGLDTWKAIGYPNDRAVIQDVPRNRPAYLAGIRPGDEILTANRERVVSWFQVLAAIRGSNGAPVEFGIKRGDEELTVRVQPRWAPNDRGENTWLVGLSPVTEQHYERYGLLESVREAGEQSVQMSGLIVGVVGQLFTGKVSLREMQGVVGIARESGQAARRGLPYFVQLMAVISMNLAILNLLPIPILDGGHLLLLAIEGLRRRDLSLAVKERFVQAGMVFLLVIFVIVMYNDVLRLLPLR